MVTSAAQHSPGYQGHPASLLGTTATTAAPGQRGEHQCGGSTPDGPNL